MAKRTMVKIDEELCNGCGVCVPNCHEGALQIIESKARLISDIFCDGLGACIGHCPQGAITLEEREAKPYDERKTMEENIVPCGAATIKAHLDHLLDHGEDAYHKIAINYLKEKKIAIPLAVVVDDNHGHGETMKCGCPGSMMKDFTKSKKSASNTTSKASSNNQVCNTADSEDNSSALEQWPIQLHLVSPQAPYFRERDVLLAADCTAFTLGRFHSQFLSGKGLAIACPKLDDGQDSYVEKLTEMIDIAKINTLTVMIMEVPCCMGLIEIARKAATVAKRKIPIKKIVVGIRGDIQSEEWI